MVLPDLVEVGLGNASLGNRRALPQMYRNFVLIPQWFKGMNN
jgi:hypothetical protein